MAMWLGECALRAEESSKYQLKVALPRVWGLRMSPISIGNLLLGLIATGNRKTMGFISRNVEKGGLICQAMPLGSVLHETNTGKALSEEHHNLHMAYLIPINNSPSTKNSANGSEWLVHKQVPSVTAD